MASEVQAWIEDGASNVENFFVDEDAPAQDGNTAVSVGGIFTFRVAHAAPHTITLRPGGSKALRDLVAKLAGAHQSIAAALSAATAGYLDVADALDEENADEEDAPEDDDDDGEAMVDAAQAERRRKQMEMDAKFEKIREQFDVGAMAKPTVERILSDYDAVLKAAKDGWTAAPRGRNLALWDIEIFGFDKGSQLEKDFAKRKASGRKPVIELTMAFPNEYPFKPPFIRVIRPRFMMRTGHVTIGGSICTKLLTDEGWQPIMDIEAIIISVRAQILNPEAKGALDFSNTQDYTEEEAKEAFHRVAEHHRRVGW